MIWLRGIFRCDRLGSGDCVVWWDAVAAVGTWAAAIATFLAVLLPYWANVRKDRIRRRLAVFDFEVSLKDLEYRAEHAMDLLEYRRTADQWLLQTDWQLLRFPPPVHAIEPGKEVERLLVVLARLRVEVANWNMLIENYEEMDGEFHGDTKRQILERLILRVREVARAIEKAKNAMSLVV